MLTHRPPAPAPPGTTFVTALADGLAAASAAAGEKYVNILGADVAGQALAAGLVDEVLMFVVPVMLGAGTPMLARPGGTHVRLERLRQDELPLATALWYRVLRP